MVGFISTIITLLLTIIAILIYVLVTITVSIISILICPFALIIFGVNELIRYIIK